ncbi:GNAT family N-acetyltransferase [Nocardia concava]|uniref:GNAT family N-acetyltransferase n=1 Tax=Nocardia concava TaxID=257281 RepID=UPI0009FFD0FA|nr:GNAT family protein [Nocardia concava]
MIELPRGGLVDDVVALRLWLPSDFAQRFAGFRDPQCLAADSQRVWGGASIYDVESSEGRAAVGYWLSAPVRGRGIASRAVRLLARWAFTDLAIMRLVLTCAPDNLASRRVAERCDFVEEGLMRSHTPFQGRRRDTLLFSLLPNELSPVTVPAGS